MGAAARDITRSSNEAAPPPTSSTTEEREAGINCEGDDGERAEEQVITARLLLERRGQSVALIVNHLLLTAARAEGEQGHSQGLVTISDWLRSLHGTAVTLRTLSHTHVFASAAAKHPLNYLNATVPPRLGEFGSERLNRSLISPVVFVMLNEAWGR
ncbi:unnamed protein product [Pleuronectes platessa]|uniref:Uncharacterized protein n=1 Tax=Pleuronectes platessa TaxID=8262 RepID=A0A9N7VKN8_PLEPL|nr:unnamed protein product [Pleuronectes platessa]